MNTKPTKNQSKCNFDHIQILHSNVIRTSKEIIADVDKIKNSCGIATQAGVLGMFQKVRDTAHVVQSTAK